MIEEVGVVSKVETSNTEQKIWVKTQIKSTCGSCEAQSNCGTGAIAKVFAKKHEALCFSYSDSVQVGQKVNLGIAETHLVMASALVYCIPLLALVVSAVSAQSILPFLGLTSELWVVFLSLLMTWGAFISVRRYLNNGGNPDFYPKIIAVLPLETQNIPVKQV